MRVLILLEQDSSKKKMNDTIELAAKRDRIKEGIVPMLHTPQRTLEIHSVLY